MLTEKGPDPELLKVAAGSESRSGINNFRFTTLFFNFIATVQYLPMNLDGQLYCHFQVNIFVRSGWGSEGGKSGCGAAAAADQLRGNGAEAVWCWLRFRGQQVQQGHPLRSQQVLQGRDMDWTIISAWLWCHSSVRNLYFERYTDLILNDLLIILCCIDYRYIVIVYRSVIFRFQIGTGTVVFSCCFRLPQTVPIISLFCRM